MDHIHKVQKGQISSIALCRPLGAGAAVSAAARPRPRRTTIEPRLNEINAGVCEHMTYAEIAERFPDIDRDRKLDKVCSMFSSC
jgi:broad specificity phosphatase PhoE